MDKTLVVIQPMNQVAIQVTTLSIVMLTHNHFKTQFQLLNSHDKGEHGLNNEVGETIMQVGFVT